ncbi:MAG: hypothetical protein SFW66_00990 [Gammaproteobacteria bacterium]|nr:hypothetical protein [Gammaproteobacteria bacterium]
MLSGAQKPLLNDQEQEEKTLLFEKKRRSEQKNRTITFWKNNRSQNMDLIQALLENLKIYHKQNTDPEYKEDEPHLDRYDRDILAVVKSLIIDVEKLILISPLPEGVIYQAKECLLAAWHIIQNRSDKNKIRDLSIQIKRFKEIREEYPPPPIENRDNICPVAKDICKVTTMIALPPGISFSAAYGIYRAIVDNCSNSCDNPALIPALAGGALLIITSGLACWAGISYEIIAGSHAQNDWERRGESNENKRNNQRTEKQFISDLHFLNDIAKKEANKTKPAALRERDEVIIQTNAPSAPNYAGSH